MILALKLVITRIWREDLMSLLVVWLMESIDLELQMMTMEVWILHEWQVPKNWVSTKVCK